MDRKNKLADLLRKVFLGSLAGIVTGNSSTANNYTHDFNLDKGENNLEYRFNKKMDLSPKLLLKIGSDNEWSITSHRSHRSHSSHQSHRSHYSSYTGGSDSKTKDNSGIKLNENTESTKTTTTALKLGSRTLRNGMVGADVTELVNILLKKQYLKLDDGGTQVTGIYTYDDIIESAVRKYQKDNGLTADGICGSTTIYYLKNK
jgi:peptidoglycan hydrolase-like protein with peptidoglycan-binding domain